MKQIRSSKFSETPFERYVVQTDDGSSSILIPGMDEMYHSRKGALAESQFVYIDHGIGLCKKSTINVLEIGFGTGLNALLTYRYAQEHQIKIVYHTLEPYPLTTKEWSALNYDSMLGFELVTQLHEASWGLNLEFSEYFTFKKAQSRLEHVELAPNHYDVILFDAFAPNKQASPWGLDNIKKCYESLCGDGLLVTYCAQGQFKRNLIEVGFNVTNPEGPMGKREISVAYK